MPGIVLLPVLLILLALPAAAQAQNVGMWCNPVLGCVQVTCEMVRMYQGLATPAQIDAATPQQRAAAMSCLGLPVEFKAPRGKRKAKKK